MHTFSGAQNKKKIKKKKKENLHAWLSTWHKCAAAVLENVDLLQELSFNPPPHIPWRHSVLTK